jgi:hypothetical protein
MNERIRQITGQVLDELVPETWTRLGYDKIKEIQNRTAELIVRECANKVDSNLRDWLHDNSGGTMGDKILEHFGIEE